MTDGNGFQVQDNKAASRFEVHAEGGLAELIYRKNGNRLVLVHTEVPAALGGHGIAGQLVQAAVDHAVAGGMTIVPLCPYARSWLERHPDQAARVPIDWAKPRS
jgi:uncharacterized protein